MAAVLAKLLEGQISLETFIEKLLRSRKQTDYSTRTNAKDKEVSIAEFVPFFLNYLREHTSHHLAWRQNIPTPKKLRSSSRKQDINQNTSNVSEKETTYKTSSRGLNFTAQRTPSPNVTSNSSNSRRDRHHGKAQSPMSSPSMRRKSPRVTPSNQSITQTPSPLAAQPRPNLDDLEDFPTIGSISTPKSKTTPSRRITPTPVKTTYEKNPSPFSCTTFVSPTSGDAGLSPTSLQEERSMLKAMKSKRCSKGDSSWGNRASPNSHSGYRSPSHSVLGDFISPTTGSFQNTKSGENINGEIIDSGKKANSVNQTKQQKRNQNEFQTQNCINFSDPDLNFNGDRNLFQKNEIENKTKGEDCDRRIRNCTTLLDKKDITNNGITNTVELRKVTFLEKLNLLGQLHATLIQENLVPNVTSEVYFIAQLLTTRASVVQQTEKEPDPPSDDNILYSIHNTVYFAVVILENLKRIICLLDKGTIRQLANNTRIADFSPQFKEWLDQKYEEHSTPKGLDISITSPIGGVPFSADRDNRNNFPSDKAFQNFRKQRDVFYELVREWEDCHSKPGWIMEENMGNRIRSLVHQRPELANHVPFARLFQSQLLQMCKGESCSSDQNSTLASLRKSNPDKFQRLQDRFVTPLSLAGPCPPPAFSEIQEFFKEFISCAESHSFSRHLMDNLVMKITELNDDTVFPFGETKDEERDEKTLRKKEILQTFNTCTSSLRILAKFLGYLVFEPYHGVTNQSKQAIEPIIQMRNKVPQPFNVLHYLKTALDKGHLVLTVPWVVEYLSLMDPLAPYLDYYRKVLILLVHIYSSSCTQVSNENITHSQLLVVSCLGWLFEIPVIPESFFFKSFEEQNRIEDICHSRPSLCMDSCDIVDQEMLYFMCPYLGEVKGVLSEASTGMSSRAGPVKKITPVCTDQPTQLSSNKRQLLQQLEENFYRIQPDFFKRTSEFIIERLCSNILSGIKTSIVPAALKKGAQQMEAYLASIGFPNDDNSDQAKERSRPQVLQLIHSVTSDAVKKALEITANSSETSLKAFQVLCPEDTNPKVVSTAANLTARHVKQKATDWIHLSLASMVEKDLFNHFDKFTNALLHAKAKEARLREAVNQSDNGVSTCTNDTTSDRTKDMDDPIARTLACLQKHVQSLKVLLVNQTKQLTIASDKDDRNEIETIITSLFDDLTLNKLSVECNDVCRDLGDVTVELVFILACRCSCCGIDFLSSENKITGKFLKIWKFLKDNEQPPSLHQLLSSPRLRLLSTLEHSENAWSILANLCSTFVHHGLVTSYDVEQWFIKLLDETNNQIIVKACCELLRSYKRQDTKKASTGVEFSLLMARLCQKFDQDSDTLTLIRQCFVECGSSITLID